MAEASAVRTGPRRPASGSARACFALLTVIGTARPGLVGAEPRVGLRLQQIRQAVVGGCMGSAELDERIAAELKQLTGRSLTTGPAAPGNPLLDPPEPAQVFGGYVEPIDNGCFRARLWLKDAGTSQVAVRDTFYSTSDRLLAELPQDAAALVLLPDWSRTASAAPYYCGPQGRSAAYPEDACDAFVPPPGCGVPFVCPPGDRTIRCATGPSCGVPGRPPCPGSAPGDQCRVRDWRLGTGIAALVVGGVALGVGGLFHYASTTGSSAGQGCAGDSSAMPGCSFNALPAAVTFYVTGAGLLATGAGLLGDFRRRAKTVPCAGSN